MGKPNGRSAAKATFNASLWLVVLGVVLSISAYSLYFVARHLGVPKLFALGMSTAFDGTALIMGQQSLARARLGMPSFGPQLGMLLFAGLSAWLNSLHAVVGHEILLAIPLWAGLPIAAVMLFEFHTSYERRRAMATHGRIYPRALPKFGAGLWTFFPWKTFFSMRDVLEKRLGSMKTAAIGQTEAIAVPATDSQDPEPIRSRSLEQAVVSQEAVAVPKAETVPGLSLIRTCERSGCGNEVTGRRDARFCSPTCRVAANKQGKRAQGE